MKKGNTTFFEEAGHLNMAGRMLYAEAVQLDRMGQLPDDIYEHVQSCAECSAEILLLTALMEDENTDASQEHPYFDKPEESEYFLTDNPSDIDALLESIRAEAIAIPLYDSMIAEQLTAAYRNSATAIKVLTPENEQLCQREATFTFEQTTPVQLILQIENHQGQVHKSKIPANTTTYTVSFEPAKQFPTGLYYWKLAGRGIKRMVGKFYVHQT